MNTVGNVLVTRLDVTQMAVAAAVAKAYGEDHFASKNWRPWHDAVAVCVDSSSLRVSWQKAGFDYREDWPGGRSDSEVTIEPYVMLVISGQTLKLQSEWNDKTALVVQWDLAADDRIAGAEWSEAPIGPLLVDTLRRMSENKAAAN